MTNEQAITETIENIREALNTIISHIFPNDARLNHEPNRTSFETIVNYAEGEQIDPQTVTNALQLQRQLLFPMHNYPPLAWRTNNTYGKKWNIAWVRIYQGDMLTLAEAAKLSGKPIQTISTLIDRGTLNEWPNPNAKHKTRALRFVSRHEIETLLGTENQ